MPAKFGVYWYQKSAFAKNAFLFNCRDNDLEPRRGARIEKGQIVVGSVGLVVAEQIVPGLVGKLINFCPNRSCEWQGLELPCMVHPNMPLVEIAKASASLRAFNYAVACLPNVGATVLATKLGVPVVQDAECRNFINVELGSFQRQGRSNPRRAKLI